MDLWSPCTHLRISASLALGPCLVPDSRVCRRPTLFMADDSGEDSRTSWMYFLPVRGVDTFRTEAWREQRGRLCFVYKRRNEGRG